MPKWLVSDFLIAWPLADTTSSLPQAELARQLWLCSKSDKKHLQSIRTPETSKKPKAIIPMRSKDAVSGTILYLLFHPLWNCFKSKGWRAIATCLWTSGWKSHQSCPDVDLLPELPCSLGLFCQAFPERLWQLKFMTSLAAFCSQIRLVFSCWAMYISSMSHPCLLRRLRPWRPGYLTVSGSDLNMDCPAWQQHCKIKRQSMTYEYLWRF